MTNREYFEQKITMFNIKLGDWFAEHFKFICLFCIILDVLLLVCFLIVHYWFLLFLFILLTLLCLGFAWIGIELWLDKEHKESE